MSSACLRRESRLPPLRVRLGADVEWILDGTGSISSGSARSRSQLNAVQRKSPPVSLYMGVQDLADVNSSQPAIKGRNPWTDRRPSDLQAVGVGVRRATHTTQNNGAGTGTWAKGSTSHAVDPQRTWEPSLWAADVDTRHAHDSGGNTVVRRVTSYQTRDVYSSGGRLKMPPLASAAGKYAEPRDGGGHDGAEGWTHVNNMPPLAPMSSKHGRTRDGGAPAGVFHSTREEGRGLHGHNEDFDATDASLQSFRRRSMAPNRMQRQDDAHLMSAFDEDAPLKSRPTYFQQQQQQQQHHHQQQLQQLQQQQQHQHQQQQQMQQKQQTSPTKRGPPGISSSQLIPQLTAKHTIPQKPLLARYDNALPRLVAGTARSEPVLYHEHTELMQAMPPTTMPSVSIPSTPLDLSPLTNEHVMRPQVSKPFTPKQPVSNTIPSTPVFTATVPKLGGQDQSPFSPYAEVAHNTMSRAESSPALCKTELPTPTMDLADSNFAVSTPDMSMPDTATQAPSISQRPALPRRIAARTMSSKRPKFVRSSGPRTLVSKSNVSKPPAIAPTTSGLDAGQEVPSSFPEDVQDDNRGAALDSAIVSGLKPESLDGKEKDNTVITIPTKSQLDETGAAQDQTSSSHINPEETNPQTAVDNEPNLQQCSATVVDLTLDLQENNGAETGVANARPKRTSVTSNNSQSKLRPVESSKGGSRLQQRPQLYPDTLRPLDNPKDALQQCLLHMDHAEWEMTMQGLTTLVRLTRHHPAVMQGAQLHAVVVALVKQVRNLRSQIARAACQVSGEMFTAFKRQLDPDLEELVGALLHRSADTNKFLRADSNSALDIMLEHCSPAKIVQTIVFKGASHKNATVRTAAARLLMNLAAKLGPERVLASPRDIRDKVLLTGANMLTEGSLETRSYAKELFRSLSSQPTFLAALTEAVPAHTLRNIKKTLLTLK